MGVRAKLVSDVVKRCMKRRGHSDLRSDQVVEY